MTYSWHAINKDKYVYNISQKLIERTIKKITKNYKIVYYNEKIKDEIPIISHYTFDLQYYLMYKCYLEMVKYEEELNIRFTHVIKLRPDLKYKHNITDNIFNDKVFILYDVVYIFPRSIAYSIPSILNMGLSPRLADILINNYNFNNDINSYIFSSPDKNKDFDKKNLDGYLINKHFIVMIYLIINNIDYLFYFACRGVELARP